MITFFYLGANIHQEALDIIQRSVDAVVLYEQEDSVHVMETLVGMADGDRAFSIDRDEISSAVRAACESSIDDRERIVQAVLSDFKVFLLRMRFLRVDLKGAFDGFGYFSDVVDYALKLAEGRRPKVVFCSYTPHTVEAWIVVRTLEELGARVVRLIPSPLPWVLLPVQGLLNLTGCNLKAKERPVRSAAVDEYLSILRGDYSAAIPYYEKALRRSSFRHFFSSLSRWSVRDIAKYMEKRAVQRDFERVASSLVEGESYAIYFLHYQPEMNTLPEAGLYCDQFQAVKKLVDALPSGVTLLIKEHPSTFSKRCDRRWRPAGFYERLGSLPNTRICLANTATFDLIDKSLFVASIAGICLTEALARGKAAVIFYTPRFAQFNKGLVIDANLSTVSELRETFTSIVHGEWVVNEEDLHESFERMMSCGYDGALDDTYIPQSVAQSAANSKRANCIAIEDVIDGRL
ncbi:MAG: hypothetical protein FHK82_05045 [Sedimenticola thiotaurini]|uniref:Capsular biosynthesis protein n=1 Tax=Sedimenticola thiotaurini TaxID=1543721 RepID=A0A558DAQ3_9GAMM|nr:MAG: hypothetical protein FHK82_05045 [Sedimenticola thiotaurini]